MRALFEDYVLRLNTTLAALDPAPIDALAADLRACWATGRRVFLCGNGGSAANALHLATDLRYCASAHGRSGLRASALTANPATLTCLANDEGYERLFALQLAEEAVANDRLLVLSGSGNSPNILRALEQARASGLRSYAIVGYDGGRARELADVTIHAAIDDMQVAEDLQLMIGHMILQWLRRNQPMPVAG